MRYIHPFTWVRKRLSQITNSRDDENEMNQRLIQTINSDALDKLLEEARTSPRRRAICRLHEGDWEHAHRMLNALTPGTYVRPHRHPDKQQGEGFILLRGRLALLIFDDQGKIDFEHSQVLTPSDGCLGMDIPPGFWHSLVALEDTVIYEVKGQPRGGYVQANDKDFAQWSPEEGSSEAANYIRQLERQIEEYKR